MGLRELRADKRDWDGEFDSRSVHFGANSNAVKNGSASNGEETKSPKASFAPIKVKG
jgi:hypothetical protein